MSPDGDTTISAIFRSKLRDIAPSRQSPRSCRHDFGSLLAGIKVNCSVLTHSHNRYPNSQSGLSPYLFIRVSPSNVYVIADASILHNIAAVRDFYSKIKEALPSLPHRNIHSTRLETLLLVMSVQSPRFVPSTGRTSSESGPRSAVPSLYPSCPSSP